VIDAEAASFVCRDCALPIEVAHLHEFRGAAGGLGDHQPDAAFAEQDDRISFVPVPDAQGLCQLCGDPGDAGRG
jgi:hypothetical protein